MSNETNGWVELQGTWSVPCDDEGESLHVLVTRRNLYGYTDTAMAWFDFRERQWVCACCGTPVPWTPTHCQLVQDLT